MDNPTKGVLQWGIGLGSLALFGLIMLILFGNLSSSSVGFNNGTVTITVINESDFNTIPVSANRTGYVFTGFNNSWSGITITTVRNSSSQGGGNGDYNISVSTANVSVNSSNMLTNASNFEFGNISISYTYVHSYFTQIQRDVDSYKGNYSESILNTGEQLPTTGTILGIALLLVFLIGILVYAIKKMGGIAGSGSGKGYGNSDSGLAGGDFG